MFVLGVFFLIVVALLLIFIIEEFVQDKLPIIVSSIAGVLLIIGIGATYYDITSPIEKTKREIITNQYNGMRFSKPVRIIITDWEATRTFAILNDKEAKEVYVEVK